MSTLKGAGQAICDTLHAAMALTILMREDETAELLWKDLDAVVAGYAELRAEILAQRIAVKR